jgi:hypothetical protein
VPFDRVRNLRALLLIPADLVGNRQHLLNLVGTQYQTASLGHFDFVFASRLLVGIQQSPFDLAPIGKQEGGRQDAIVAGSAHPDGAESYRQPKST